MLPHLVGIEWSNTIESNIHKKKFFLGSFSKFQKLEMGNTHGNRLFSAKSKYRTMKSSTECLLDIVPEDVLFEISLRLPAKDLLLSCALVCKGWHDLIETEGFWRAKCVYDNVYSHKTLHLLPNEQGKRLYMGRPYIYNLIKNYNARDGKLCL